MSTEVCFHLKPIENKINVKNMTAHINVMSPDLEIININITVLRFQQ